MYGQWKISKSLVRVPHDHCACCCLRPKSGQWQRLVEIVFGCRKQDYWFLQANQPKMSRLNIWQNTWSTFFISFASVFSSVLKKKQTHCTCVCRQWHKDVKAQRKDHVTTRLPRHRCKNLTHTSKTHQVKRIQMFATGRFTMIGVFVTFSDC